MLNVSAWRSLLTSPSSELTDSPSALRASTSSSLPAEAAQQVANTLGLDDSAVELLKAIPLRGSVENNMPADPTIYRFYEMMQVYGTTFKALVHEQFGDGIISAINFKVDMKKVEDPEGGSRAVLTLDGKFLPYKPF